MPETKEGYSEGVGMTEREVIEVKDECSGDNLKPQTIRFAGAESNAKGVPEATPPWFATCDWGDCDGLTVGWRFDDDADSLSKSTGFGWLPVCQKHWDEELSEARRMKL